MRIREFIIETIGYKLFPCFYNRFHDPLFEFIKTKTPREFLYKEIWDIGCGDGKNTIRIKKVFQPKNIYACDRSEPMLKRAKDEGLKVQLFDFNKGFPKGEMATFTYSLHHAYDKEKTLNEVVNNFDYIFICEPYLNLFHIVNWGHVPSKKRWVELFDKVFGNYTMYDYDGNLIVFYKNQQLRQQSQNRASKKSFDFTQDKHRCGG
jgi:SAM-dependent methyltransferase